MMMALYQIPEETDDNMSVDVVHDAPYTYGKAVEGPSTEYAPEVEPHKYDLWWLPSVICFMLAIAVLLVVRK